jgi:hypothetical protein
VLGITLPRVPADLDRFLAMVCRELGARGADMAPPAEATGDAEHTLRCAVPDGRTLIAHFDAPPPDRDVKQRRLEMLAATFDSIVDDPAQSRRPRPPVTTSLHDELVALCTRASAWNAIVIDANSPVVWAAAHPEGVVAQPPLASSPRIAEAPANDDGDADHAPAIASRRAIHAVRGWPELAAQRKGKHVRKIEREVDCLLAHSFAGIYLLVLVFEAAFDELRAERAVVEALPRIERLVLALPPLDPQPWEGRCAARDVARGLKRGAPRPEGTHARPERTHAPPEPTPDTPGRAQESYPPSMNSRSTAA